MDKFYTYYHCNEIKSSQGTYLGKPVHGEFIVLTKQHSLIEKGYYHEGLKHGLWLHYDNEGRISNTERWKHGELVKEREPKHVMRKLFKFIKTKLNRTKAQNDVINNNIDNNQY